MVLLAPMSCRPSPPASTTLAPGASQNFTATYILSQTDVNNAVGLSGGLSNTAKSTAKTPDGVSLVASYEFTPSTTDVNGYAYGGRAQQWLSNHVRLGVTGSKDKTGAADQTMLGADIRVQHSEGTYVEAEIALSEGPGFGYTTSSDGGLTISEVNSTKNDWGVKGDLEVQDRTKIGGSYTSTDIKGDRQAQEMEAHIGVKFGDKLIVTPGIKHSSNTVFAAGSTDNGSRTDVGANISYKANEDQSAYIFGQATVARSGGRKLNNRVGIGDETKLSEKVKSSAEVSYGTVVWAAWRSLPIAPQLTTLIMQVIASTRIATIFLASFTEMIWDQSLRAQSIATMINYRFLQKTVTICLVFAKP